MCTSQTRILNSRSAVSLQFCRKNRFQFEFETEICFWKRHEKYGKCSWPASAKKRDGGGERKRNPVFFLPPDSSFSTVAERSTFSFSVLTTGENGSLLNLWGKTPEKIDLKIAAEGQHLDLGMWGLAFFRVNREVSERHFFGSGPFQMSLTRGKSCHHLCLLYCVLRRLCLDQCKRIFGRFWEWLQENLQIKMFAEMQ